MKSLGWLSFRGQVRDSWVFAVGWDVRLFAYVIDAIELPAYRPRFAAFPPVNDYHLTVVCQFN